MKKILIIEDNKDVRENTADILELAGYETATAEDGKRGVEETEQFHPDLIVCDIMMPRLDGYGVLEALSKKPETARIPFIFLTAKSEKDDFRKGMNLGADDYLTKPFEEHELLEAVEVRLQKNDFLKKEYARDVAGVNEFLKGAANYLDLESISREYRAKEYMNKDFVFMEGDVAHDLFYIEKGAVKTYKSTETGKEFVTGIHKAGDFMGQLSLLNPKGLYLETATVMKTATLYKIPKSSFIDLIERNREVANKFMELISNSLIDVQEQLVYMAYASVRQRVAKALLRLSDNGMDTSTPHNGIEIPREDFAGMVGTATETAIRTLSDFRDEGLISMGHGRSIILLDKEQLQHIADTR
ncbi:response regulator [Maribacter chungangensis]|uniref:Response regulator n=1 Tax=Maribacter chungangensis TaxID=1069117 RepID=A0ABW3B211_9FLAO